MYLFIYITGDFSFSGEVTSDMNCKLYCLFDPTMGRFFDAFSSSICTHKEPTWSSRQILLPKITHVRSEKNKYINKDDVPELVSSPLVRKRERQAGLFVVQQLFYSTPNVVCLHIALN